MPANGGYDAVVEVDDEGDLGHTDLQDDLEFHSSSTTPSSASRRLKQPTDTSIDFEDGNNRNKIPSDDRGFLSQPSGSSSEGSSKSFLWSLSFYAQYFDVDTSEVLKRCYAAIYPRANFLDVMEGNPDLYGPVWITTTVVLIIFLTATISNYLALEKGKPFVYNFKNLSGAAGLFYGYTGIVPIILFFTLKWFGSESANLLECWALYGYSNITWIPVALISWSSFNILNFVFVAIGYASSALFLFRNLYPILNATPMQISKILLIVVLAVHAGVALAIKILFFS